MLQIIFSCFEGARCAVFVSPTAAALCQEISNASGAATSRMWPADRGSVTPS